MKLLLTVIWSLYTWSYTTNSGGDVAAFQPTDNANIFVIDSCVISEQGLGFSVHSDDWSTQYGWSDAGGGVVSTGVAVELAPSNSSTGWMEIPAGAYDVTFDLSVPSIRFDTHVYPPAEEPEPVTASFLRGADLTMATYVEDWGATFRYEDGTPGDVFDIMQSYGINLARLRLYHTPGTAVQVWNSDESKYDSYRTQILSPRNNWTGYPYACEEDILNLAQRAKAHDMAICLSIYLSDYWSGAATQFIPAAWSGATTLEALGDSVYNYVTRVMTHMVEQGTTPEYVSVGNETNYGILFNKDKSSTFVDYGGHTTRNGISNTVYLFNRAYAAIKAVSPTSQVIIHHSYGHAGKIAQCRSFFQQLKNNGCNFDIVGGSYYPYWASEQGASGAAQSPTGMLDWAADMETNIDKPVMIMEVGYSWTPYRSTGRNGGNYEGQLHLNGSYYNEASEDGQAAFMHQMHEALSQDDNILGYMYWDPILVDQLYPNASWWIKTCWAEKYSTNDSQWYENGNVVSNTTLFDYSGYPLKALWSEIASLADDPGMSTAVENPKPIANSQKQIRDGRLLIMHEGRCYNALGVELK